MGDDGQGVTGLTGQFIQGALDSACRTASAEETRAPRAVDSICHAGVTSLLSSSRKSYGAEPKFTPLAADDLNSDIERR